MRVLCDAAVAHVRPGRESAYGRHVGAGFVQELLDSRYARLSSTHTAGAATAGATPPVAPTAAATQPDWAQLLHTGGGDGDGDGGSGGGGGEAGAGAGAPSQVEADTRALGDTFADLRHVAERNAGSNEADVVGLCEIAAAHLFELWAVRSVGPERVESLLREVASGHG